MPGGAASGFRHVVKDQYTTRLLQVKGKQFNTMTIYMEIISLFPANFLGIFCISCMIVCHQLSVPSILTINLPHLLTCTGKRTVRVKEVPTQSSSLTQGDVYILDAGLLIYIFCGPTANMFEKSKGTYVCVCVCVHL